MRLEYPRTIDKQMLDIFLKAQNALIDELYFAIEAWKDYAHITARLNSINTELKTSFSKYISASTQEHYIAGAEVYDKDLWKKVKAIEKLPIEERILEGSLVITELWWVNTFVVASMIEKAELYVSQSMDNVLKWIMWWFSEAKIAWAFETIATEEVLGSSIFKSREALEQYFRWTWAWFFVDKGGKRRTLARYSEMLIRTEKATAQNMGIIMRGKELWITKFKRIERADCCPICVPYINTIWDISKDGMPYMILHPNCNGVRDPIFT